MYASFLKVKGHQGIFSLVKGTLWGNVKFYWIILRAPRQWPWDTGAFVASVKHSTHPQQLPGCPGLLLWYHLQMPLIRGQLPCSFKSEVPDLRMRTSLCMDECVHLYVTFLLLGTASEVVKLIGDKLMLNSWQRAFSVYRYCWDTPDHQYRNHSFFLHTSV